MRLRFSPPAKEQPDEWRLPYQGAGRPDACPHHRFNFDGKSYTALQGDTVASALLANGVHLIGRSFKYHRRAAFCLPVRKSRMR